MTSQSDVFWRSVAVVVLALTLVAGTTRSQVTDRTRDGLKGAVRQVTTTSGGSTTTRTYDRGGALLETISRLAPSGDEPDAREQTRRFEYVYDARQQRVREMSQDQDGPPYLSRRYAYDVEGRQRAEAAYHMCGTFSSLHVSTYDRDGRLHEDILYQFRSLARRVYEYDGQGHPSTILSSKNGRLQSTLHYRYDEQGRVSEQAESMPDGTPGGKTAYEYDEQGQLVAEYFTNGLDPALNAKSMYEYDPQGNWTRKTTRRVGGNQADSPSDKPLERTERTILYF